MDGFTGRASPRASLKLAAGALLARCASPDFCASRSYRFLRSGRLGLFAVFSSRDAPMRLHNKALIEAALFPANGTVLTFVYVDRDPRAPFGLRWSDLKELTRDPLCIEERAFRVWLRQQERKKAWPCHRVAGEVRRPKGRPSDLIDDAIEAIEELDANGKLTLSMPNKEVHALVQLTRTSLRKVSEETVRRARNQANVHNGSRDRPTQSANRPGRRQ